MHQLPQQMALLMKRKSTHSWSAVSTTGGTDQEIQTISEKSRSIFWAMDRLWKSKITGSTTKLKIFNSRVLFYAS